MGGVRLTDVLRERVGSGERRWPRGGRAGQGAANLVSVVKTLLPGLCSPWTVSLAGTS